MIYGLYRRFDMANSLINFSRNVAGIERNKAAASFDGDSTFFQAAHRDVMATTETTWSKTIHKHIFLVSEFHNISIITYLRHHFLYFNVQTALFGYVITVEQQLFNSLIKIKALIFLVFSF